MKNIFLIYLILINIIAFIMYGADKRKAVKRQWRIPERTLIGVAVLGGGFGALLGMRVFHHKTKHPKFTIGVPAIIIIEVIIAVLLAKVRL
jgi:uncharacterized membrane protein YsdA (DUF1294 family)